MNYLTQKIAIAGDHAGFELKSKIIEHLQNNGFIIKDFGTDSSDSVDYPDFVHPMASAMDKKDFELGIVICGSGNGVNITANKYQNVRSALCWQKELAELARLHNDANILALPARFISQELAISITDVFLSTPFEGGRHQNRVAKISCKA